MREITKVFMNRDNMTTEEANIETENARAEMYDIIESGGTYEDIEDMMLCDYGLEMDYIMDLLI